MSQPDECDADTFGPGARQPHVPGRAAANAHLSLFVQDFWFAPRRRYVTLVGEGGGPGITLWDDGPEGEDPHVLDGLIELFCAITGAVRVDLPTAPGPDL